jgi:hypothetical protein
MVAISMRSKIIEKAHRDAKAFFREFRRPIGADQTHIDWLSEAWFDICQDFDLAADEGARFWPDYREAFVKKTVRLAAIGGD